MKMFGWVGKIFSVLVPFGKYARLKRNGDDDSLRGDRDESVWFRDLERHAFGEFSFAVVQANENIEDHSQVETGGEATFMGVYDGHGGYHASSYVCRHLFSNLIRLAKQHGSAGQVAQEQEQIIKDAPKEGIITEETLRSAFAETEQGFLEGVRKTRGGHPDIAANGSCCLVGLIFKTRLYVCNMGDSRAVLGQLRTRGRKSKIVAEQITEDHNASNERIRTELRFDHPNDPQIVSYVNDVWWVKGIIQITRSIGDAYLKMPEFAFGPSSKYHLAEPINRPVLKDQPEIHTREIQPTDQFLIFATDGLWEHITNTQAVEIVHRYPRLGIARRLMRKAMSVAAKKANMTYEDLRNSRKSSRRSIHDDISVIVVFIDHNLLEKKADVGVNEVSIKGFNNTAEPSEFRGLVLR